MREIYLNKTFYLLFDKNVTKSYNCRSIKPPCNTLLHPDNDDFSHKSSMFFFRLFNSNKKPQELEKNETILFGLMVVIFDKPGPNILFVI
jgi:hypothetical protein